MDFSDKMQNSGVLHPLPLRTLRVSEFTEHSCSFMLLPSQTGTQTLPHLSLLY